VIPRRGGGDGLTRVLYVGVRGGGAFTLLSPGRQEVAGARASPVTDETSRGSQDARAPGQLIAGRLARTRTWASDRRAW
jgi:hypothetical protein